MKILKQDAEKSLCEFTPKEYQQWLRLETKAKAFGVTMEELLAFIVHFTEQNSRFPTHVDATKYFS